MDAAQIERVKTSYASLQPHWEKVINRCFDRLLVRSPGLKDIFPSDLAPVRREFGKVIALLVEKADRLQEAEDLLRDLGKRHRGYGAEAAHYPFMRDALVAGMKDVAGKDWNFQLEFAWKAFMNDVAKAMHYGKVEAPAQPAEQAAQPAPEAPPAEAPAAEAPQEDAAAPESPAPEATPDQGGEADAEKPPGDA